MALTQVNSNGLKDDSIVNADVKSDAAIAGSKLAADSIAEEKLDISNSASDGQYLQYKDSTDKLTWASVSSVGGATGVDFNDGVSTKYGDSDELQIRHNSSGKSIIYHSHASEPLSIAGDHLQLADHANEHKFVYCDRDGAVELYYDNGLRLQTTDAGVEVSKAGDSAALTIKGGEAEPAVLFMYADEGDDNADKWRLVSWDNGSINLQNYASGSWEHNIECNSNGNVELYFDNVIRLETTSSGVTIPGGQYLQIKHDTGRLTFGADDDLTIYHDGSHGYLKNTTGDFYFQGTTGENHIVMNPNAGVKLLYDDSVKFETTSAGISTPGHVILSGDGKEVRLGASADLSMWHGGGHSKIQNSTGNLYIWGADGHDGNIVIQATYGEESIICEHNGGVKLYYDNSIKFETKSTGPHLLGLSAGSGHSDVRYQTSDGRLYYDSSTRLVKTDIVDSPYGISALKQLKPRKYKRTDIEGTPNEIGFIADEVLSVVPEIVPFGPKSFYTKKDEDTEQIPINVDYRRMTVILTKALQEAITKIETLETKVAALEAG